MGIWESLAVSGLVLLVVYLCRPGLRAAMEKSRQAESQDWRSLLMPLVLVILFVMMLIVLAQSTSSKRNTAPEDTIDTHLSPEETQGAAVRASVIG